MKGAVCKGKIKAICWCNSALNPRFFQPSNYLLQTAWCMCRLAGHWERGPHQVISHQVHPCWVRKLVPSVQRLRMYHRMPILRASKSTADIYFVSPPAGLAQRANPAIQWLESTSTPTLSGPPPPSQFPQLFQLDSVQYVIFSATMIARAGWKTGAVHVGRPGWCVNCYT